MLEVSIIALAVIVVGLVLAAGVWLWSTYNALIALNVSVQEAWSGITVQLKRRADLIPNLVETVKAYAAHEKDVFEAVTVARSAMMSASTPEDAGKAENMLNQALKSVFAVAEAYPALQSSQNYLQLQAELADTENKIMAARNFYNSGVRKFNTSIKSFPQNLFVSKLGFTEKDFFDVEDAASIQEPPKVQF